MKRHLPLAAMLLVTLLWAGNFVAGKFATRELHWAVLTSFRVLFASAVFAAASPRGALRGVSWRNVAPLALTGIVLNLNLFAAGITWTTPGHSAIIQALIPVFVVIIGWAFLREQPSGRSLAGMVLAVGGAVLLALSATASERAATLTGDLITCAGMLCFSTYVVLGRNVVYRAGPFPTVTAAFVLSVPMMIPLMAYGAICQDWSAITWKGWAAAGYMALGATVICYSLHLWALTRLDALQVSIFTDAQPILAAAIAYVFGLERPTFAMVAAGVIVIGGVVLVQTGGGRIGASGEPSAVPKPVQS